jgi:hypothetical protein
MADTSVAIFERLAREYLAARPDLRHEWRSIPSRWLGDRLDLVVAPRTETSLDVWATLRAGQFAVGAGKDHHEDFEDFGRGVTDAQLAQEAFDYFVTLLHEHGYTGAPATSVTPAP